VTYTDFVQTIVFVGDVDRSYRCKLFLEQFGIKSGKCKEQKMERTEGLIRV
jgi:hypothetical protein